MLSVHGLVIIAEPIKSIQQFTYMSSIKFWVASDIGNDKTQRFLLDLQVPTKNVEAIKAKIEVGKVCEITHADIIEIPNKTEHPDRFTTNICIRCRMDNLKFLSRCIYYENLTNITKEKFNE